MTPASTVIGLRGDFNGVVIGHEILLPPTLAGVLFEVWEDEERRDQPYQHRYAPVATDARRQPRLGLKGDRGFLAGTRVIVAYGHRAFGYGSLNAALDRLMMQSGPAPTAKNDGSSR